jgi:hypothetical protein
LANIQNEFTARKKRGLTPHSWQQPAAINNAIAIMLPITIHIAIANPITAAICNIIHIMYNKTAKIIAAITNAVIVPIPLSNPFNKSNM